MKVKIWSMGFVGETTELEKKVLNWLKQNPRITVLDKLVTTCTGTNGEGNVFVNITIILFYEEEE